MRGFNRW